MIIKKITISTLIKLLTTQTIHQNKLKYTTNEIHRRTICIRLQKQNTNHRHICQQKKKEWIKRFFNENRKNQQCFIVWIQNAYIWYTTNYYCWSYDVAYFTWRRFLIDPHVIITTSCLPRTYEYPYNLYFYMKRVLN